MWQQYYLLVDGRWGPWGAYTKCSKKCGGGSKSRKRVCVAPKYGGKPCAGAAVENTKCNTQPCPGKSLSQTILTDN